MSYQPPPPSDPNFYGQQPQQPPQVIVVQGPQTSGAAVTSLVLGILGLVSGCCTFGIFSVLAVIFGHMALPETKTGQKAGHGMAVAGLVMGYIVFLPALLLSIFWGIGIITGGGSGNIR